jgi:hypothetical protein
MINANYPRTSLYSKTNVIGNYLDIAKFPAVPKYADDVVMTVNKTYQFRPDLLAYDLYGDSNFWWAFALRNPNVIKDPVFDMKPGVRIYIPKKTTLNSII